MQGVSANDPAFLGSWFLRQCILNQWHHEQMRHTDNLHICSCKAVQTNKTNCLHKILYIGSLLKQLVLMPKRCSVHIPLTLTTALKWKVSLTQLHQLTFVSSEECIWRYVINCIVKELWWFFAIHWFETSSVILRIVALNC